MIVRIALSGLVCLLSLTSHLVHAEQSLIQAEAGSQTETKPGSQVKGQKPVEILVQEKEPKIIGVGLKSGAISGVPVQGIEIFYSGLPKLQLGIQYLDGKIDLKNTIAQKEAEVSIDKVEVRAQTVFGIARYFIGDSFNVYGILGHRSLNWDIKVSNGFRSSLQNTGEAKSPTVGVGIGNTWSWDSGFFIGGDWLSYGIPLSKKSSYHTSSQGITTSGMQEVDDEAENAAEKSGNLPHVAMLFSIGWKF